MVEPLTLFVVQILSHSLAFLQVNESNVSEFAVLLKKTVETDLENNRVHVTLI